MKTLILFALFTTFCQFSIAQSRHKTDEKFIYGKMVNEEDILVGYFRFDDVITQNGQTVFYKKEVSGKVKHFQSRKYDYFDSEVLYMEKCGVLSSITGDLLIMIPRVINGPLQLFEYHIGGTGFMQLSTSHVFYLKKGDMKMKIKAKRFKEQLRKFVGDDKTLLARIDSEELKYESLHEIVSLYNQSRN